MVTTINSTNKSNNREKTEKVSMDFYACHFMVWKITRTPPSKAAGICVINLLWTRLLSGDGLTLTHLFKPKETTCRRLYRFAR